MHFDYFNPFNQKTTLLNMQFELAENEKALEILKKEGPKSVSEIAEFLQVTTEGARFHVLKLEKEGLVGSRSVAEGRGRPKQIWFLTDKGNDRFPDTHATLSANLIQMMRETLGEDAVDKVIDRHQQTLMSRYAAEIDPESDLEQKIGKLAEIRSREGYMADYTREEGHYLFMENHCPICSATSVCQGFCKAELTTFEKVLGDNVKVERVEHIIEGARRCCYQISKN